jgi:uncharacterized protein YjhX (UPF0386 family)
MATTQKPCANGTKYGTSQDQDQFMREKVIFFLITDGDRILDEKDLCKEYPNIQCITRDNYHKHFGQIFETLKSLKESAEADPEDQVFGFRFMRAKSTYSI